MIDTWVDTDETGLQRQEMTVATSLLLFFVIHGMYPFAIQGGPKVDPLLFLIKLFETVKLVMSDLSVLK